MISKLSTPSLESASKSSGASSNKLLWIAGLFVGGFLLYRFVIKPEMDKQTIVYESTDDGSFE